MDFCFRHSMPGRLRLSIPALGQSRRLGEACLAWLKAQDGVRSARINYDCASLVLEYDPAQEQRLLLLLGHFKSMSLAELKALSSRAASIGVRVSETRAEIRMVKVRVMANSRKSRPTISPMNSSGISTAISDTVNDTIVNPICSEPFNAASSGESPSSR